MFQYLDEDGNFIIESGSDAVPVFKISGSITYVSGTLIPGDPLDSASAELGSEEHPWKELYVESASINFVDTQFAVGNANRKVRFSRKDVEDLKAGRSINDSGVISASGDMHVVGNSLLKGRSVFEGLTQLKGETQVTGALSVIGGADFRGHFRINGTRLTEDELTTLQGITATTAELNKIDGFTGVVADLNYAKDLRATGVTSTEFNKLDGYTGDHNDLNYAKDLRATGVTATEFNKLDGFTGDHNDLNYAKDLRATGVTTTEFDKLDGLTATATELNLLDGVSGLVQADLTKLAAIDSTATELNLLDGITHIKDENNMSSDSDTSLATQQSIKAYVDANAGGGGTVDSSLSNSSTNAVRNSAVHAGLATKATTAGVVGDLLPDADGTRDLGASGKEWQDLYVDGVAYTDSISNSGTLSTAGLRTTSDFTSQGLHILGGQGAVNITSLPTNGLLDARQHNTFYMGVDGTYNGIRGAGVIGQVVTIISPAGRRNDFIHASTNVNIGAREKFAFMLNRNQSVRGPMSVQFIYDGVARLWYRLQ